MPFVPLLDDVVHGQTRFVCRSYPHREHAGTDDSGDAVFVELGEDQRDWLVLVIDVMGHGPQAREIVDWIRDVALADQAAWKKTAAVLMERLDAWLAPVCGEKGRYVCCLAARHQGDSTTIELVRAGIPDPLIGRNGAWTECDTAAGRPHGLGEPGEDQRVACWRELAAKEVLLLLTDGITESLHQFGRQPNAPALRDIAPAPGAGDLGKLVDEIVETTRIRGGEHWGEDDTTIAAISSTM